MQFKIKVLTVAICLTFQANAHATPSLIATGLLSGNASDLSGLTGNLESGIAANLLGGMGSGLAWAGGNTFLALQIADLMHWLIQVVQLLITQPLISRASTQ